MKYENEYKQMIDAWGKDAQIDMCIEEMAELTQALCKYKRNKRQNNKNDEKNLDNIQEEIADVLNCTNQMAFLFGEKEVNKIMDDKIQRTLKKLK